MGSLCGHVRSWVLFEIPPEEENEVEACVIFLCKLFNLKLTHEIRFPGVENVTTNIIYNKSEMRKLIFIIYFTGH